jgi:hypothetical protein
MTAVNWLATVQMPCSLDPKGPICQCPNECPGTVDAWLVGPWDGMVTASTRGLQPPETDTLPPADLVALTEACQTCDGEGGWTDSIDIHTANGYGGQTIDHPCPDCIDGHPAVEVVRLCGRCHGAGELPIIGTPKTCYTCRPLGDDSHRGYEIVGRGTIRPDHILPVIEVPDTGYPKDKPERFVYVSKSGSLRLVDCIAKTDTFIELDIDVSPGQYVAIVIQEATDD